MKRVHRITRPVAVEEELEDVAEIIAGAKKPLIVVGGGVRYSEAGEAVEKFCEEFKIPFGGHRPERVPASPAIRTALAVSVGNRNLRFNIIERRRRGNFYRFQNV